MRQGSGGGGLAPFNVLRALAFVLLVTGCLSFGTTHNGRLCFDDEYDLRQKMGSSATCAQGNSRGFCLSHSELMRKYCSKTCHFCGARATASPTPNPTPSPTPLPTPKPCYDDQAGLVRVMGSGATCYQGKAHGYCASHPKLLRRFCAKTCGLCSSSGSHACAGSPCLNGGTCVLTSGSGHRLLKTTLFVCRCPAGHSGARCGSSSAHGAVCPRQPARCAPAQSLCHSLS